MKPNAETIKSAPLKSALEVVAMLNRLPRDERLRVEGIVIGLGMRYGSVQQAQNSA